MPPFYRVASLNLLWRPKAFRERFSILLTELTALQPAALCLQEMTADLYPHVAAGLSQLGYTYASPMPAQAGKHWNVTFSRQAASHTMLDLDLAEEQSTPGVIPAIITSIEHGTHATHLINTHLRWGGDMAGYRLRQVEKITTHVQTFDPEDTVVLLGDLNTGPESSAIRYLTGLQEGSEGQGTFWIDAWAACGAKPNHEMTNDPSLNFWARETCERHNLDPAHVPARRIDYILTHGWKYGGRGAASKFSLFARQTAQNGITVSDHYGVWADIAL